MPFDIGIGLMLGVALSVVSGLNYQLSITIGVISCLLPDLDYVWSTIVNNKAPDSDHRDGLHYPLLFIPVVGAIGFIINPYIGVTLVLGSLAHFMHDSVGVGWGIKWLYPFKSNSFMFLYRAGLPTNKNQPKQLTYSWSDEERTIAKAKYGDDGWIRHIYLEPHVFGVIEYTVLIIGVLIAIINW